MQLFNCCFDTGRVPGLCCRACIVTLYERKSDGCECSNSRDTILLSAVGELYGRVLISRIVNRTDGVLVEEQCGLRSWGGCFDQLSVVRNLCEKFLAQGKDLLWAFMDLGRAYDRVNGDALWQVLLLYGAGG